jgi:hypothetical protein
MNLKELASVIAKKEAKKSQVTIGNVREILCIIAEELYLDEGWGGELYKRFLESGKRQAKKAKK